MSRSESQAARPWSTTLYAGAAVLAVAGILALGIYFGLYNVAADIPHTQPVYWLLEKTKERSIAVRAAGIAVPANLADPKRITSGAGQYADMCAGCHLAPGMKRTEMSRGLYPRAPVLHRGSDLTPAQEFWVVKHGIKATGMPAWGVTHDDDLLWDIVAFLRKLPDLSAEEYQALVKSAPSHEEIMQEGGTGASPGGHAH